MASLAGMFTATHGKLIRLLGGNALGGGSEGGKVLVLRHEGAKTGKVRETPLQHHPHQGMYAVAASNGGDDKHPGWYHNLLAHPDTTVYVAGQDIPVRARVANAEERTAVWSQFTSHDKRFGAYAERTTREIPVVLLDPS